MHMCAVRIQEGGAWAMDRLLITAVPDDVAVMLLPRECYGGALIGQRSRPATAARLLMSSPLVH